MQYNNLMKLLAVPMLCSLIAWSGCSTPPTAGVYEPLPAGKSREKPTDLSGYKTTRGKQVASNGMVKSSVHFPGGYMHCPLVLEKTAPKEAIVGQDFEYVITAKSIADYPLYEVVVTDQMPPNYAFGSATPAAQSTNGNTAKWVLGKLGPKETKTIRVKGRAKGPGTLTNCAKVTFTPYVCVSTAIIQPSLKLTKTCPTQPVLLCDNIPMTLTVTNTGSGSAKGVKITDNLPDGLMTTDGKRSLAYDVGTLGPGQSKKLTVNAKASRKGSFTNTATATAAGGLTSTDSCTVVVKEPVLSITKSGPAKMFIGRNITYSVTVKNTGDAPAQNTVIEDQLPAGAQFVSATAGGQPAGGKVVWNAGTIPPGGSKNVSVTVKAGSAGDLKNTATAKAHCAKAVSAVASTKVTGIPAILLEVVDLDDPIEVGTNVVYEITVTNQGSAVDTNIKLVVNLEKEHQYVSSTGVTRGTLAGKTVTFAPLPALNAKQRATWRVTTKAVGSADVRLKVTMNSDQLGRPVEETEATNFFE